MLWNILWLMADTSGLSRPGLVRFAGGVSILVFLVGETDRLVGRCEEDRVSDVSDRCGLAERLTGLVLGERWMGDMGLKVVSSLKVNCFGLGASTVVELKL